MFDHSTIIGVVICYLLLLFIVALWVERKSAVGVNIGNNPYVYAISFGVYCTTWTYYGSVGKAATSGMLFLTVYLGPTLAILTWWTLLRKMIRIKNRCRITSIADFISARYNNSRAVAAITTIIAIVGILPYVAIQLKAIIASVEIITDSSGQSDNGSLEIGLVIVACMIFFTIMFGVRRLDPTERHQGMVVALALECVLKLVAFLAAGIFVTYFLFDGFADILTQAQQLKQRTVNTGVEEHLQYYMTWSSYLVLSTCAFLFLPRQFHIAVIENFDENHIRTAMWFFPLYLFLINIFVFPIAMGGLLSGLPVETADTFVLSIPLQAGYKYLSLLVFIGGFSAGIGMVMISSMTMSTMITNHLLLPVVDWIKALGFLKRYLLQCRWLAVAGYIIASYLFDRLVGESYMLVNIGMISFAAVLQFAPALLGGLFWKKGNLHGAICGLAGGFLVWFYTLLIPTFVKSGWLSESLTTDGPFGIALLRPENLCNLRAFDPLSHAVFWSILVNSGCYILFSLIFRQDEQAEMIAKREFVEVLEGSSPTTSRSGEATIPLVEKVIEIENLFAQYFSRQRASWLVRKALNRLELRDRTRISMVELIELHGESERMLAGSIGAAAAYHALRKGLRFSSTEQEDLSHAYANILADLKLTPQDLKHKIDYYQERHDLLNRQAAELEEKVAALNREIEERRLVEKALRKSEEKYHTLIDNVNIGVFRTSGNRGRFLQANPAMATIFGYDSLEEFLTISAKDLYQHSADHLAFAALVQREGSVKDHEILVRQKDGSLIWCSITATTTYDENGQIAWLDGVVEDVTERRQLEEQLRHAQKMEAMGTLAGGIAHDFNNILTALMGYSNLLKLKLGDNQVLHNYVDQILISAEKAANLTQSLLTFSRKQIISADPVDLNDIVLSVEKLLQRLIGDDIDFQTVLAREKLIIMADSSQIEQILINLATNAADAMPVGGMLTLKTEQVTVTEKSATTLKNLEPGQYSVVTASDTGCGMDEDTMRRIFEPFFTTKATGKGTGLGLSIAYGIIKQHNGDIHVYSEPGVGTSFKLYLPLVDAEVKKDEPHVEHAMLGGSETILVAEDNPEVLNLIDTVLSEYGYTVIPAINGEDAVHKYTVHRDDIDLILLDVVMPKLNGKEALNAIRAQGGSIKAIFSSGYTADIIERKGILEEGLGFLPKPVLPHVLLSVIRETLDDS